MPWVRYSNLDNGERQLAVSGNASDHTAIRADPMANPRWQSNCKLILKENWVQVEPGKASSLHVKESETHNGPCYQNSTCIVRIQELPTTGFEHSIYVERPAPFELLDQEGSL